ncbi:MAG TPA: hypothetical protein VKR06_35760 [Ktedonosporobacter sp.]|nr:hypothetical protein [Ktedonosporobacter sp.]
MPNHMTALGFPVTTEQDFRHYVYQTSEFGEKIETPNGSYTLWTPGNGIELWVQTNLHRRLLGMNPHFSGQASMRAHLTARILRPQDTPLDGAFHAWANPTSDDPESGLFPFVFDSPDYDRHNELQLPHLARVQIAAFAHQLKGFASEEEYMNSQGSGIKFASESFIPSGLFTPGPQGKNKKPPQAQAIFSGRVIATQRLTNPVTNQKFYWAQVHVLGGEIDIVADPQVVEGKVVEDGIVSGTFWLSGRLLD